MQRDRCQVQDRIVQSNPVPVQVNRTRNLGARAKRALFQDPTHLDPSCISERIVGNDLNYDSDHSMNGTSLGFNDEHNDDSEITRK
ncbi:hypothetical protein FRX31_010794 [Thalictrum thalictroides]|uniref:Uncharacterized protein n=1 Tax=Thalictrum thalictroides TaxID=46969 RepID=A0A7J6WQH6_THATH|nr:hypothetical protein FRX31_010794 [Thalictrum thalictroides]